MWSPNNKSFLYISNKEEFIIIVQNKWIPVNENF